ncbi:hypothetical protein J4526_07560 [Desulfurococcaceae archaeon MEX13E-LK6-19]|nr:hypothetical protein J4526_07560 [Desulfurococcaceae archaeon MEX13E-LK6-19]
MSSLESKLVEAISQINRFIEDARIINYRNYTKKFGIDRVKDFRRNYLFKEELSRIEELLKSYTDKIDNILKLINEGLVELKKDGKYVAYNTFLKEFRRKVEEVNKNSPIHLYRTIIRETIKLFDAKIPIVMSAVRHDIEPKTIFWLYLTSFAINVLIKTLDENLDIDTVLNDVVSEFRIDFIYGFSYVETHAHTVIVFGNRLKDVITRIDELVSNREKLDSVYNKMKVYLSNKRFPYDIRHPVVRRRSIFDKNWDSLIVIGYPEASRGYERVLTRSGVSTQYRRLASVLYIEFMVSKDRGSMLLALNVPFSKLKKRSRVWNIINDIVRQMIGVSFEQLLRYEREVYSIPAEKLVEEIKKTLEGRLERELNEALDEFKNKLVEKATRVIDSESLQYKDKLRKFVSSLTISKLYLRVMLENKTLMRLEIELSDPGVKGLLPHTNIKVFSEEIKNLSSKAKKEFMHPKTRFVVGVSLQGRVEDYGHPSIIEFTSEDDVFFHNMNREYVTELSYILWKASEELTKE